MFVYMTGHVDIWDDADNNGANQAIRDHCNANDKMLYDFADIERYDPDGNYYEYANDNCDYCNSDGDLLGNWATEWQNTHIEGLDWYSCSSAHSEALNANRKAYAAWWLWAQLAGWRNTADGPDTSPDDLDDDAGNAEDAINDAVDETIESTTSGCFLDAMRH